jgi:predicted transposase YbfD/YdcC
MTRSLIPGLLALKRNQQKTYHAVTTHFHDQIEHHLNWRDDHNFFDAFDDSQGRTVRRRVWSVSDLSLIAALDKWEGLHSMVAVETIRQANRQAKVTRDYRFYLSSLVRSAKDFASLIRQHWILRIR